MPNPAPNSFKFCPTCATPLITRLVGDKPRRACPDCGWIYFTDPKVGVGVMVTQDDKVLLVKRRMMPEKGKWSLPAGFVDRGENPKETAAREVLEETNMQVEIKGLIDVYFNNINKGVGASIFILYRGQAVGGNLQAGDDAEAAAFFAPHELPELGFDSTKEAIQTWKEDKVTR